MLWHAIRWYIGGTLQFLGVQVYQMLYKGERKMSRKEAKQQVEAEALIIQQFRLFVCMMRASIRKQSDCITKSTKGVQIEQADDIRSPLIQSIICLVAETVEAILSLRAVSCLDYLHIPQSWIEHLQCHKSSH